MVTPAEAITPDTLRIAHQQALRVHYIHRGLIPYDDLRSECYEWLVKNAEKTVEWLALGRPGKGKIAKSLYFAAQHYARAERARMTGGQPGDHSFYSTAALEELLRDVWDYDNWTYENVGVETEKVKGAARPSEGMNRLAMLVDVKWALAGLPADEQALLRDRYADGGTDLQIMAAVEDMTVDAMRRKVDRILGHLADRLGGEPPWHVGGRRRARSNASAQSETRAQA